MGAFNFRDVVFDGEYLPPGRYVLVKPGTIAQAFVRAAVRGGIPEFGPERSWPEGWSALDRLNGALVRAGEAEGPDAAAVDAGARVRADRVRAALEHGSPGAARWSRPTA